MICLADTNVVIELAACELIDHLPPAIGADGQVYVLHELMMKLLKDRAELAAKYTPGAVKRALAFAQSMPPIDWRPDEHEFRILHGLRVGSKKVDLGEAVLVSASTRFTDFRIGSADRAFLECVAAAPQCAGICRRLRHRVICLEQMVVALISYLGFGQVCTSIAQMVVSCANCDHAMVAAFGVPEPGKASCLAVLERHVEELRTRTGDLLVP